MTLKPLELAGARALADAGAVATVHVLASEQGLCVIFNNAYIISNRLKQPRYFAKADTVFSWLRDLGIKQIDHVNLSGWRGNSPITTEDSPKSKTPK
jgi:hypothetical protein